MQFTLPWILATLSTALLLGVVILWRTQRRTPHPRALPTEWALSARPVFSTAERRAYRQLSEALPHHIVLSKLPLVRFCQPVDPNQVRYWYELLGGAHVSFAICSANGRVLAAIDLDHDRSPSRRSSQIKQSVLAACRVRYLRCPADHLPSIPELQLLVPQAATAARGPQAAAATTAYRLHDAVGTAAGKRREFTTLWQDSAYLQDSFFHAQNRHEPSLHSGFSATRAGVGPWGDAQAGLDDVGGVVVETPPTPAARAPVEVTGPIATGSPLRH